MSEGKYRIEGRSRPSPYNRHFRPDLIRAGIRERSISPRDFGRLVAALRESPHDRGIRRLADDCFAMLARSARRHASENRLDDARIACEKALELNPRHPDMRSLLDDLSRGVDHSRAKRVPAAPFVPAPRTEDVAEPPAAPAVIEEPIPALPRKVQETGIGILTEKNELLSGARFFFDSGWYDDAFSCAAELVRDEPTVLEAAELVVAVFRRVMGWEGEITARALHKKELSSEERIARVAEKRIFVANYLRGLPIEQRVKKLLDVKGSPLLGLIGGPSSFRAFSSIADAAQAAGVELPSRKAKEKQEKPPKAKPLPPPPWPELGEECRAERDRIKDSAEALYKSDDYAGAASLFEQAVEIDPNDIESLCFGRLSALMRDFPFLEDMQVGSVGARKQRPALRSRRKMFSRVRVIRFLKKHPSLTFAELRRKKDAERTTFSGSRQTIPSFSATKVYSLVAGPKDVKVFDSFTEAHAAVGLGGYFPDVLERIKRKIQEEFESAYGVAQPSGV